MPLPQDMANRPPDESCTDVYGTRPPEPDPEFEPSDPEFEPSDPEEEVEWEWEVTESATLDVSMGGFDPVVLRVPYEAQIDLTVTATGTSDHRLIIDGLGVDVSVEAGETQTVTVRPTQPGVYHMYCELHSSSNALLHGRFIVER